MLTQEQVQVLDQLPPDLWSQSPTDVGLIKGQDPIKVKIIKPDRPNQKQYPITKEAHEGIKPVIEDMPKAGIL